MTDAMTISQHARALYRAHGDKAEAEAAKRERVAHEAGKEGEAVDWRRIRASIHQIRGANQT
ncbi:MAG: hypothetical protein AAFY52_06550 [Pseudomonadota bacterium]